MKSDRTKGRILAVIQFALLFIIIVHAITERTYHSFEYSGIIRVIAIVLLVIGDITFILTIVEFRQVMTPNPVPLENAQLRTRGIYSLIRHPMYLSVILMILGGTLYLKVYHTLILDLIAVLFLTYKIGYEEKMLLEKFPSYKDYQSKTKKLIPFVY